VARDIAATLVRAIARPDLADAIIGDLHERRAMLATTLGEAKASRICRSDVMRSLFALLAYGASRTLADDWLVSFVCAAVTCAFCVATIPLWGHLGMGGAGYHVLRLAIIGLVLGCIPRAATLSCIFLTLLIAVSDWTIDTRETGNGWRVLTEGHIYALVLQDALIMATMLVVLQVIRSIRALSSRLG